MCVCVCKSMGVCEHMCADQRTTYRSQLSPATTGSLELNSDNWPGWAPLPTEPAHQPPKFTVNG